MQNSNNGNSNGSVAGVTPATNQPTAIQPAATQAIDDDDNNTSTTQSPKVNLSTPATPSTPATSATAGALEMWKDVMKGNLDYGIQNGAYSENGWEAFKNMFRYEYRQEYEERQKQIEKYEDGDFSDIKEKEKLRESSQDNYANNLGRIFNVSNGKAADQLLTGLKARVGDGLGEGQNATNFYKIFTPDNVHILSTCLQKGLELHKHKDVANLYEDKINQQHAAQMGICLFAMCMVVGRVYTNDIGQFVERYKKMNNAQRADMTALANAEIGRQMMAEYSSRIVELQDTGVLTKEGKLIERESIIDKDGKFVKVGNKISIDNIKGFANTLGIMNNRVKSSDKEAHNEMLKAGATYNLYREMWAKTFKDSLEVGGMDPNDAKKLTDYIFIPKADAIEMKNRFINKGLTQEDIDMLKNEKDKDGNLLYSKFKAGDKMDEQTAIEALKQIRMHRMKAFLGEGQITPEMRQDLEKLKITGLDEKEPVITPPAVDYTTEITAFNDAKTKAEESVKTAEESVKTAEESVKTAEESVKTADNALALDDIKIEFTDIESKTLDDLQKLQEENQQHIKEKTKEMEGINIEDVKKNIKEVKEQIEKQKTDIEQQAQQGNENVDILKGTDNDKKNQAKTDLQDNTKALNDAADKINQLNTRLKDLQQEADKYKELQNEIANLEKEQGEIGKKIKEKEKEMDDVLEGVGDLFNAAEEEADKAEKKRQEEEEKKRQEEEERKRLEEEKKLNDAKSESEEAKQEYNKAVEGFNIAKTEKLGKFDEEIKNAEIKKEEVSKIKLEDAKEFVTNSAKIDNFKAEEGKSTEQKLTAAEEFKKQRDEELKQNKVDLDTNRTALDDKENVLNKQKAEFENQKKALTDKIEQYKQKLSSDKNTADGIKAAEPQGLTENDATTPEEHNKNTEAYKKATAEVQRQSEEMKQDINKQDFASEIAELQKLQQEINEKQQKVDELKQTQQNLEANGKGLEAVIKDVGGQINNLTTQKQQEEEAERQRLEEEAEAERKRQEEEERKRQEEEERKREEEEKKRQAEEDLNNAQKGYEEKLTEFERGAKESKDKIQGQEDELSKLKNDVVADVNIAANVDAGNSVDITDVTTDDINTLTDEAAANAMIQNIETKQREVDDALQTNNVKLEEEKLSKTNLDNQVQQKQQALNALLKTAKEKLETDKTALTNANSEVETIKQEVANGNGGTDKPAQTTMYNKKAQDVENQTNALPKVDNDFTKIEAAKKELQDAVNKQQQCNVNIDALQSKQNDLDVKNKALSEAKKAANDKKQSIEEEKKPPMTKYDFDEKLKRLDEEMKQLKKSEPKFGMAAEVEYNIEIQTNKCSPQHPTFVKIDAKKFNNCNWDGKDLSKPNPVTTADVNKFVKGYETQVDKGDRLAFENYVAKPIIQTQQNIKKAIEDGKDPYSAIGTLETEVSKQSKNATRLQLNDDEVTSISNCFTKGLEEYQENLTKHNAKLQNLQQDYQKLKDAKKAFTMNAEDLQAKINTLGGQQVKNNNALTNLKEGKKKYDETQKPTQQSTTGKENTNPKKNGNKGQNLNSTLSALKNVHQSPNNTVPSKVPSNQRQQANAVGVR